MSTAVVCFSHLVCLLQVFINCLEQLSTKTDDIDSSQWVFGWLFFGIFDDGVLNSDDTLRFLLCVQRHFSGPVLSRSVSWHSGGLQSNICKCDAFLIIISFKQFGFNTAEIPHLEPGSVTKAWALSFTQPDKHVSHSFKPRNVIRLFPGCGQEADTSSFPVTCLRCWWRGWSTGEEDEEVEVEEEQGVSCFW